MKFWIDSKKFNRIWFGKDKKETKYNWVEVGNESCLTKIKKVKVDKYTLVFFRGTGGHVYMLSSIRKKVTHLMKILD